MRLHAVKNHWATLTIFPRGCSISTQVPSSYFNVAVPIDWSALEKILGIRSNTLKSGIFRNLVTVWLVSSAERLPSLRPNSSPRHDLHHCYCVDINISRHDVKSCKIFHSRRSDVQSFLPSSNTAKAHCPPVIHFPTVVAIIAAATSSTSSSSFPSSVQVFFVLFSYCLKMADSMPLSFFPKQGIVF